MGKHTLNCANIARLCCTLECVQEFFDGLIPGVH